MKDLRQSPAWANYLKSIGWQVENINNTYIYLKHLPLLGWYAKIQRPSVLNDEIINFIERKYHPFQISIEPLSQFKNHSFKLSNSLSLPTKTLITDLTKSKEEL